MLLKANEEMGEAELAANRIRFYFSAFFTQTLIDAMIE